MMTRSRGMVLATAPDTTGVIVADLDFFSQLDKVRDELPSLLNRRPDIYSLGEAA